MSVLIVVLSVLVPTAFAILCAWIYRKWQDREGRRSPLENKQIFGPGEQLRKRIEGHTDNMMGGLIALFWLGPYFLAVWALPKIDWTSVKFGFGEALLVSAFGIFVACSIRLVVRNGRARRMALEGLKAEIYTAHELNRLIASGCTVLHDVPAEGFNLDHVVIGAKAVFLVETKSVRKPAKNAVDSHKVAYDGMKLRFPHFTSSSPIDQAKREAEWLRKYLQSTLRRNVPVVPTVALPGWWIDSPKMAAADSVRVFNPAGRGAAFMSSSGDGQLDAATSGLITQALLLRFPTT